MRSRTPPISSEFRGGGLNTPNPPSRYATAHFERKRAEREQLVEQLHKHDGRKDRVEIPRSTETEKNDPVMERGMVQRPIATVLA